MLMDLVNMIFNTTRKKIGRSLQIVYYVARYLYSRQTTCALAMSELLPIILQKTLLDWDIMITIGKLNFKVVLF